MKKFYGQLYHSTHSPAQLKIPLLFQKSNRSSKEEDLPPQNIQKEFPKRGIMF